MPLGARDVLFVLRAQDFASREVRNLATSFRNLGGMVALTSRDMKTINRATLDEWHAQKALGRSVEETARHIDDFRHKEIAARQATVEFGQKAIATGMAVTAMGAAIAITGVAASRAFLGMAKDALETRRAIALASTQGREMGGTISELSDIARDVALAVPVPLDQLAEGLYDIRSSLDETLSGQRRILGEVAKSAVAGQVDMQEAMRASIAIMNAWELPASSVTDVLDVQFRMVERGVGTYGEFAGAIGRAIPAAVRLNQDFDRLGATMAFLTRRGLSTEMAATAAARAMELLADPKARNNMEKLGIVTTDAEGNFIALEDIVRQLAERVGDLPGPERAGALKEIFGGAGYRIQARRFFDLVLPNFQAFQNEIDAIASREGAMQRAYQTMLAEPAVQADHLRNIIRVLRESIGEELLTSLAPVVTAARDMTEAFRDMDPELRRNLVRIAALSAVLLAVVGTITAVIGFFTIMAGAMAVAGVVIGGVTISFGWLVGMIALAIGIAIKWAATAFLVTRNWGTIKQFFSDLWASVVRSFQSAVDFLSRGWDAVVNAFNTVRSTIGNVVSAIAAWFSRVVDSAQNLWTSVREVFTAIGSMVKLVWDNTLGPVFNLIVSVMRFVGDTFRLFGDVVRAVWDVIAAVSNIGSAILRAIFQVIDQLIRQFLILAWIHFMNEVKAVWEAVAFAAKWYWNNIVLPVFRFIVAYINNVLIPMWQALQRVWNTAWEGMSRTVSDVWNNTVMPIWNTLTRFVREKLIPDMQRFFEFWRNGWNTAATWVKDAWNSVSDAVVNTTNSIISRIESFLNRVIGGVNSFFRMLNRLPGVEVELLAEVALGRIGAAARYHKGGLVRGGIGEEVPALLEGGEGVLNRRAMAAIGPEMLERLNRGTDIFLMDKSKREKGGLIEDFFAKGKSALFGAVGSLFDAFPALEGPVGRALSGGVLGVARDALKKVVEGIKEAVGLGGGPAGPGWRSMWGAVQQMFPWVRLHSGYRPGAITATGRQSYHALGRAIDITPSMQIAEWIRRNYMDRTKELIFSPMGRRQVRNGSDWYYTGVTRGMHWDHIHWAMAKGGIVTKPTRALIGERGPEAVIPLNRIGEYVPPGALSGMGENVTGFTTAVTGGVRNLNEWLDRFLVKYKDVMHQTTQSSVDAVGKLNSAIGAMRTHLEAQHALGAARTEVQQLGAQLRSLERDAVFAQRAIVDAWNEARRVTAEEELAIIQARQRMRQAADAVREFQSGVVALRGELGVLRQEAKVEQLREALEAMQQPDMSAVTEAQRKMAEAAQALQEREAAVTRAQADLVGARFEMARIQPILGVMQDEVQALLLRFKTENQLADAQEALAGAQGNLLQAQQESQRAQQSYHEAMKAAIPSARELRIAQIELRLAEEELANLRRSRLLEDEQLREAQLNLGLAQRALTQAERDAVGPTEAVRQAQERAKALEDLRTETQGKLKDAIHRVSMAELAAMDATLQLVMAGQVLVEIGPQQYSFYEEVARKAGVAASAIHSLIAAQRALARESGIGAVRGIFERAGVPIATTRESAAQRLARINREIAAGRTLADVERSVKIIADRMGIRMQHGGIVTRPTFAFIGEAGRDEAVVPLPRGWRRGRGALGGVTVEEGAVQVNFNGPVTSEAIPAVQRVVDDALDGFMDKLIREMGAR